MYTVYIIQSKTNTRYYTGHTKDIIKRMDEHNKGQTKSTRVGIPWSLIHSEVFDNKGEAVKKEKTIKSRGAERYLKDKGLI